MEQKLMNQILVWTSRKIDQKNNLRNDNDFLYGSKTLQ